MGAALQDTIEREVLLNAPAERVFLALTQKDRLLSWFPQKIDGEFKVGSTVLFVFGEGDSEDRCSVYVDTVTPNSYFAYRWVPGSIGYVGDVLSQAHTLVEFFLEDADGKTRLKMVESGFASLPSDYYDQAVQENTSGWDYELKELQEYVESIWQ